MVSNEDARGIFSVLHSVPMTTDLFRADDPAGEYVGSHSVDATISARWQRSTTAPRLLDWKLVGLSLEGLALSPEAEPPTDFPLQPIINAATISSKMRKRLEEQGVQA